MRIGRVHGGLTVFGSATVCILALAASLLLTNSTNADLPAQSSHLLYFVAESTWPEYAAMAESDKLTVAEYRKRGIKVTEKSRADLAKWIEGDGKVFAKARENFQMLEYAKSLKADAFGGLTYTEIDKETAEKFGLKAGVSFGPWGMSIGGLAQAPFMMGEEDSKPRTIPLNLAGSNISVAPIGSDSKEKTSDDSAWVIPTKVEPQSCTSSATFAGMMPKRAFLGVQLDGTTIVNVVPKSPAEKAGLMKDDKLTSVAGVAVVDQGTLRDVMGERKPGDEMEIEYQRGDAKSKAKVTVGEMNEVLDASRPKEGQPLPELTGKDMDGKEIKFSSLKGKVVLLDFWATWCGPCVEEIHLVHQLAETLKGKDFVWLAVSADSEEKAWRDFIRDNRLGGVHMLDQGWTGSLGVQGFPTVMVVDRKGVLRCSSVRGSEIAKSVMAVMAEN